MASRGVAMNAASVPDNAIEGPARWSLRLFGGFELGVLSTGERLTSLGKRERVLLAYLALSPKCRQPRRKLATLLWGDALGETALDNFRVCIWSLRKALSDTEHRFIASEGEDIVLNTPAFEVDAWAFRRLAAQSGRSELEAAAKLYEGEFLEGLDIESEEFESWRRAEAARCKDQVLDLLGRLMTQLAELGETERAIEAGLRILRLEQFHEPAVRRLMRLYGEGGRRGPAIQLYRRLADALKTQLDAQPEAETRALFAQIARGVEERSSAPVTVDAISLPRLGSAMRPSDATAGPPKWFALPSHAALAVIVGVLVVTTALISYRQFAIMDSPGENRQAVGAEQTATAREASPISIAVLPFGNLSGDAAQEFFSDGMTEEITAALAKVPALQVVARASAFQFKGEKRDMRAVGRALGARYVIDGSVRKAGERVRITAQLIRTDSGVSVWSDSYDRELTDVFAIQEDIATAIAGALRISLGLAPGERLDSGRSIDPESYQQFLRARPLVRARSTGVPQAIGILEPVVTRNPDYAPAWALLASSYSTMPTYAEGLERRRRIDEFWPKAEVAARRAIQLDPNLADAYFALGRLERVRGNLVAAHDLFSKALSLDPNNPDALGLYMLLLANVGRQREALATAQQLRTLEPYVPTFNEDAAEILWENGQNGTAIEIRKSLIERPAGPSTLAMMYASSGRYTEAADVLENAVRTRSNLPQDMALQLYRAAGLLRAAPAKAVLQSPPHLERHSFIYLYVGDPARSLEYYEDMIKSGMVGGAGGAFGFLWHPSYAPVRKTERFKALMRKAGMVDYWRAKGWPEFCHPVGANDFICN